MLQMLIICFKMQIIQIAVNFRNIKYSYSSDACTGRHGKCRRDRFNAIMKMDIVQERIVTLLNQNAQRHGKCWRASEKILKIGLGYHL